MTGYRVFRRTLMAAEDGSRLDGVVTAWLSRETGRSLSKSAVRKLVMAGAVRVDGRAVRRPGLILTAGTALEARVDMARLEGDRGDRADARDIAILYEDDDLIAVAKPAGLQTHASADPRRPDLFSIVRNKAPYLGLHHRLDVGTSGVVLFTKRESANAGLAKQFAAGEVTKVYHAIAASVPPDRRGESANPRIREAATTRAAGLTTEWRTENWLAMSGGGRNARMQQAASGGVRAATSFGVLERMGSALLVEARPETGRRHQIRAHLALAGVPILGDARYGGAARVGRCLAGRVMLHAIQLSFEHPATNAPLTIVCPYPEDFEHLLRCLRSHT